MSRTACAGDFVQMYIDHRLCTVAILGDDGSGYMPLKGVILDGLYNNKIGWFEHKDIHKFLDEHEVVVLKLKGVIDDSLREQYF